MRAIGGICLLLLSLCAAGLAQPQLATSGTVQGTVVTNPVKVTVPGM